jgi:hypothetical protein
VPADPVKTREPYWDGNYPAPAARIAIRRRTKGLRQSDNRRRQVDGRTVAFDALIPDAVPPTSTAGSKAIR